MHIYNWYHSLLQSFRYIHRIDRLCTRLSPCSPCFPFHLLGTLLAVTGSVHLFLGLLVNWPLYFPHLPIWPPPSCDRNRPPQSQVACKLTPFAPPFTQLFPPSPDSQKPNCPAPYYNDLGNIPALVIRNTTLYGAQILMPKQRLFFRMREDIRKSTSISDVSIRAVSRH